MPKDERQVVAYARVSRDRGESRSIPEQFDELRRWAARETWTILGEHSDTVSASRYSAKARPGWMAVMDLINSGTVAVLLLWEISRSSRDRQVYAALLAACVDNGVKVGVNGKVHDPSDPDDGFMLDLGGALSVRESAMTSKRTRRDVEARALLGRPHGSLPYGYKRVIDPETGRTIGREPHPDHAPVVREIVRRLLAREPADKIAKDLNARGIPTSTGAQWRGGNLFTMARRPVYAGLRQFQGKILEDVQATWEPLISVADHHRLNEMHADPDRDKFRNSTAVKHLLTGIARCGLCGGPMRVVAHATRPAAYACRACMKTSRNQAHVDEAVTKLVVARLSMPDALAAFSSDDAAEQEARAELARLEGKLREARQAWEDDELSLSDYKDMKARLSPKIDAARERARPKHLPEALEGMVGPDAADRWQRASVAARRTVLDALLEVTVRPVGRGGARNGRKPVEFDPSTLSVTWRM